MRELHLWLMRAAKPRRSEARELVVLQPGRARRLRRRRALLQLRLGRARGPEAHRHAQVPRVAAHRRVRLLVHAGDDEVVAASIPGCRMTIMRGMGHFPMIENYTAFRPFLA